MSMDNSDGTLSSNGEKLISDSLMDMTFNERDKIYSLLPGVADTIPEDDGFISRRRH